MKNATRTTNNNKVNMNFIKSLAKHQLLGAYTQIAQAPKFMQSNDEIKMDFINLVVKQAKHYAKKGYTFEKMLVLIAHKGSSVEYVLGKAWATKVIKFTIAK